MWNTLRLLECLLLLLSMNLYMHLLDVFVLNGLVLLLQNLNPIQTNIYSKGILKIKGQVSFYDDC